MVVGSARNDGFQQANQQGLADGSVRVDNSPDFLQERVRIFLRPFHPWFAIVFAEILLVLLTNAFGPEWEWAQLESDFPFRDP